MYVLDLENALSSVGAVLAAWMIVPSSLEDLDSIAYFVLFLFLLAIL